MRTRQKGHSAAAFLTPPTRIRLFKEALTERSDAVQMPSYPQRLLILVFKKD
jgi:hypothetical protein